MSGLKASRGLQFKQPFKSPLRVLGTEKTGTSVNASVTKSPTVQSVIRNVKKDVSPPSDQKDLKDEREDQSSKTDIIQEVIGVSNSTPKKPVSSNCPRRANVFQRKVSPSQFSSPFRSPVSSAASSQPAISKEEKLNQLLKREKELDDEVSSLKTLGLKVEELQGHIENLHQYNEIKDSAQLVMGRLAEIEGITVKEMHDKYHVTVLD